MAINVFVQFNGGLLPDILLLTQAPVEWFDGTIIVALYYYYPFLLRVFCFVLCRDPEVLSSQPMKQ